MLHCIMAKDDEEVVSSLLPTLITMLLSLSKTRRINLQTPA